MPQKRYKVTSPDGKSSFVLTWNGEGEPSQDDINEQVSKIGKDQTYNKFKADVTADRERREAPIKVDSGPEARRSLSLVSGMRAGYPPQEEPISDIPTPPSSDHPIRDAIWNFPGQVIDKIAGLPKAIIDSMPVSQMGSGYKLLDEAKKSGDPERYIKENLSDPTEAKLKEAAAHPIKSGLQIASEIDPTGSLQGLVGGTSNAVEEFGNKNYGGGTTDLALALAPFIGGGLYARRAGRAEAAAAAGIKAPILPPEPITNPARLLEAPKPSSNPIPRAGAFIADESGNVIPPDRGIPPGTTIPVPERPIGTEIPPLPVPNKLGNYQVRDARGRLVGKAGTTAETNLLSFENYPPEKYPLGETRIIDDTMPERTPTPTPGRRADFGPVEPFPIEEAPTMSQEIPEESLRDKILKQPDSPAKANALAALDRQEATRAATERANKAENATILSNITAVEKARIAARYPHLPPEKAVLRGITDVERAKILERKTRTEEATRLKLERATEKANKKVNTSTPGGRYAAAKAASAAKGTDVGSFNLQPLFDKFSEKFGGRKEEGVNVGAFDLSSLGKLFEKVEPGNKTKEQIAAELSGVAEKGSDLLKNRPPISRQEVTRQAPINMETPEGQFMQRIRDNQKLETAREFDLKAWRAEKAASRRAITTPGEKGHIERKAAMEGASPAKVMLPPLDLPQHVIDTFIDSAELKFHDDEFTANRAGDAIRTLNRGEYLEPADRMLLSELFPEQYRKEINNLYSGLPYEHLEQLAEPAKTLVGKTLSGIKKWTYGSAETLMSAMDASFAGIQGRGAMDTKAYYSAAAEAAKALVSQEAHDLQQQARYKDPMWTFITKDMGVHMRDMERKGIDWARRGNKTLENLSVIKSNHRAAISFLNHIAFENAKIAADLAERMGVDMNNPEALKSLGRQVNESVGYGSLNKTFTSGSKFLSHVLWSPRLVASRINYLKLFDPREYQGKAAQLAQARRAKSAVTVLGTSILGMKMLEQLGGKCTFDATSGKFGKCQVGDQIVDTTAGFGPLATLTARIATGTVTNSKGEKHSIVKGEWGQDDAIDLITNYFENKANPKLAYIEKLIRQRNPYTSEPYNIPAETLGLSIPMFAENVYGAIKELKEQDPKLAELLLLIPSFGGANTYEATKGKKRKTTLAEDVTSLSGLKPRPKKTMREQVIDPTLQPAIKKFRKLF